MNADLRRKLEMGIRALTFGRAHPDASAGYTTALAHLEERIGRAELLATQQRAGTLAVRGATVRKRELHDVIRSALLHHVSRVAQAASKEEPTLTTTFQLPRKNNSYQAFRTAARAMADEAVAHKDLFVRHGLAEPMLGALTQTLDQFDAAVAQSIEGREAHIGAGAELLTVVEEIMHVVEVMDGLNRYRFADDSQLLAAWEAASNVLGPFKKEGEKPAPAPAPAPGDTPGGEVKPAA